MTSAVVRGMARAVPDRAADDAFLLVVTGVEDRLLRLATLLTGNLDEAEDVVAEVVARVYRRWQRGRLDDPHAYLRVAVVNEVRRRGRRSALDRRARSRRTGDGRGTTGVAERIADRQAVLTALQQLGERQRLAVVLRYVEDLSVADTAAVMGTSEGTVKSQVARALAALRTHLGQLGADATDQPSPDARMHR
jgi:RNA polymerase sigma-70 factor (sigma-E family)